MKVKTTYKAGESFSETAQATLQDVGQKTSAALQSAGQAATETWQKALPTLSNPKFWTWPF